jgi:hypothetical protein
MTVGGQTVYLHIDTSDTYLIHQPSCRLLAKEAEVNKMLKNMKRQGVRQSMVFAHHACLEDEWRPSFLRELQEAE